MINGKTVWDVDKGPFPHLLINESNPLASDCNFREDILAWIVENSQLA